MKQHYQTESDDVARITLLQRNVLYSTVYTAYKGSVLCTAVNSLIIAVLSKLYGVHYSKLHKDTHYITHTVYIVYIVHTQNGHEGMRRNVRVRRSTSEQLLQHKLIN